MRAFVWKQKGRRGFLLAARYEAWERRVPTWLFRSAILPTTVTRSAISFRVNPSGNTTWKGFGMAITVSTVPVGVVRVTVR